MRCSKSHLQTTLLVGLFVLGGGFSNVEARSTKSLPLTVAVPLGAETDDRPPVFGIQPLADQGAAPDTFSFGYVDTEGFAVLGEIWNFDHGGADPFEGWTATDLTLNADAYYRHITEEIWQDDTGNAVDAPVLSGVGSAWLGVFQNEADDLCWEGGLGYGNSWRQLLTSPILSRGETSSVSVEFSYFTDLEQDFEFLTVYLRTLPSGSEMEVVRFTHQAGLAPTHPSAPPVGTQFSTTLQTGDFGGETDFQLVFRMTSDGGWADDDGQYDTSYGPLSLDDIRVEDGDLLDVAYGFEASLEGWTPEIGAGAGSFFGIANVSDYTFEGECPPALTGNLVEFHDDFREHPTGQHVQAITPPVDVLNDVPNSPHQLEIFADWDQYSEQPRANGVFYRPGWDYYPFVCPNTEEVQWSGRTGQATYFSTGDDPVGFSTRNIATDNGVPSNVEQIRFIFEIISSCDGFTIPPEVCTGVTNFTPLLDNVQARFTYVPVAPSLSYDPGDQFQDGFNQSLLLDLNDPGNADQVGNTAYPGNGHPIILGDSLHVVGPVPSAGYEYDTKLWFRVAKKGPGSNTSGFDAWRERVENGEAGPGINIEEGDFAWAYMDSSQIGEYARPSHYHSYYNEKDIAFDAAAGEISEGNEIIPDGILLPGTQIEYFVTANYITTPNFYSTLPDTTGGFFSEFEILPGWVHEDGVYKFPALLYVDAFNAGAQYYIEAGFDALGLVYDRYDYLDASSNWKAPLARGLAGNSTNGATKFQLLGYRGILVNMGNTSGNVMWPEDFTMLSDWLTTIACDGNLQSQGLIINGDNAGKVLSTVGPALLYGDMDATFEQNTYREASLDHNYCVNLEVPSVGAIAFGSTNTLGSYSYDAWGNGCPNLHSFDVLGALGSGVGNRAYVNVDSEEETFYAQVTNEVGNGGNFRTVLDGVSWHHTAERDLVDGCVVDSAGIVTAIKNEAAAALEWIFDTNRHHIPIPEWEDYPCNGHASSAEVVGGSTAATQLFQNSPNPFNPRTLMQFNLSSSGPAVLAIFDVGGRVVRTVHDGVLDAGAHEFVWDGTDDRGHTVAAGVYWSQLDTDGWSGNKKMILVK